MPFIPIVGEIVLISYLDGKFEALRMLHVHVWMHVCHSRLPMQPCQLRDTKRYELDQRWAHSCQLRALVKYQPFPQLNTHRHGFPCLL